jgi:hypothetical protein
MGGPMMSALTTVATCFALIAAIIAGLTAWWLFTDPAAAATAIESRDWRLLVGPLARGVARALLAR